MLWPIPFIFSSCIVFSYIAHPRTPIPTFIVIITSYCELFYLLSFPLLRSVLTVPNTLSIAFSTAPSSFLRSRAHTGCPGVRHFFLYVSQLVDIMTGRLRISGQPMGSYVRLFQLPSSPIASHSFLLLSWSFVYIRAPHYLCSKFIICLIVVLFVSPAKTRADTFGRELPSGSSVLFPRVATLAESASGLLSPTKMKSHLSPTSRAGSVRTLSTGIPLYRRPKRKGRRGGGNSRNGYATR